jgi:hypothetical protein
MQSGAAKSGTSAAIAAQLQAQDQARADTEPWRTAGTNALGVAGDLSGANGPDAATAAMGNFFTSPGYQFRLDQGLRAVDAGAAASGLGRSGAAIKAEETFGQGLASSEFSNYYNRLYDLSKLGEAASVNSADASGATGRGIAATDVGAANAQSSIYGNTAQGLGNTVNSLFSNKDFQGMFKSSPAVGDIGSSGYTTAPGMTSAGYTLAPGF